MLLVIGNKNYSTWSLRAWLILYKSEVKFEENLIQLDTPEFYTLIKKFSPAQKVPTLVDGALTVWDSLAICEYINDSYMSGTAWPEDTAQKTKARSLASEMHSGFVALRNEMPMNIRARRSIDLSQAAKADIARIDQIWSEQFRAFGDKGGWLFGRWSIADAMYAPVALRFQTYGIELSPEAQAYQEHVISCDATKIWIEDALKEEEIVNKDEAGTSVL
ncbi:glutathione S-transferase family protein [Vibrio penaeicida]|uniref:glutathione S-transferase family protein n=1 Tax=Vibrio penaeicida TaxID=104609 RepID=UPI002734B981|nr:glutathione S-transferase family protein [Vibrio penaeicida]MDP2572413.1 glutathione S-transferase family protein [Vibrio penaeicida]